MPELPEVETIRRQLAQRLTGQLIKSVKVIKSDHEQPRGKAFERALSGRRILSVERRAKLLIWKLDNGDFVIAHLKMTGSFVLVKPDYQLGKHDRIEIIFEHGARLIWSDVRRFGFVKIVHAKTAATILENYGPEPLQVDAQILADRLLEPKSRKIKTALLNQEVIAGIGNIYADEVLFKAKMHPLKRLGQLTVEDRLRIGRAIKSILALSIKHRGTTRGAGSYRDAEGMPGEYIRQLKVYGRTGQPCKVCGTSVQRIVLGQRGTHFCPHCQPC